MEATTFKDARVIEKGREFVLLKADVTRDQDPEVVKLMAQFKIRGVPTLVFIGTDGRERTELRRTEYTSADELLKLMGQTLQPSTSAVPATGGFEAPAKLMQPF
jgi:thiol:disulfide interchange protein DsbD